MHYITFTILVRETWNDYPNSLVYKIMKTDHSLGGAVVGLTVGVCVGGAVGLAEAGTMEHLPLLNLKSSTAISPW
jgi:hypothetical protein